MPEIRPKRPFLGTMAAYKGLQTSRSLARTAAKPRYKGGYNHFRRPWFIGRLVCITFYYEAS